MPAEQRLVVGGALNVWPLEVPHDPLIAAGAAVKVAVTVQFVFTALVVYEVLPFGVPPQVPPQVVLLDPGFAVTVKELPPLTGTGELGEIEPAPLITEGVTV